MRVCMHSRADAMQPQVVCSDVYVRGRNYFVSSSASTYPHPHTNTDTDTTTDTNTACTDTLTSAKTRARAHIACIDSCCGVRCIERRRPCTDRCKIIVLRNAQKHIVVSQPYGVFGEMFEKTKILYTLSPIPTTSRRLSHARNEETGTHSSTTKRCWSRTGLRAVLNCYYTAYSTDDGGSSLFISRYTKSTHNIV